MKIGIFAGTFDPIHNGHIEFATSAVAEAGLDKVIIVAEKEPYRKKPHAAWDHRQAMIERATEQLAQVDHDYGFASHLAHQHTMKDMLGLARKHYGPSHEYWFLAGSDIFEHMHQWKERTPHHEYGGFVVALRDEHSEQWLNSKKNELEEAGIIIKTILISNKHPHVSSSAIRTAIGTSEAIDSISKNVADYITAHNLYH